MTDRQRHQNRGSLLPFWAMMSCCFVFAWGGQYLLTILQYMSFWGSHYFEGAFVGVIQAQAGLFCIMGGALGRSWISSFFQASAVGCLFVLIFLFLMTQSAGMVEMVIASLGVVPLLLFCGCLPFLGLRSVYGLHLTRSTTRIKQRYSLGIEDMLLTMMVVAGLFATCHRSINFLKDLGAAELSSTILMASLLAIVASTLAVVPVSMFYFRDSTRLRRTSVLCFFAVLGLVASYVMFAVYGLIANDLYSATGTWLQAIPQLISATVFFSIGLVLLYWSGFRWRTNKQQHSDNDEHKDSIVPARSYRYSNRIAAMGFIASSIGVNGSISYCENERSRMEDTFRRLHASFLREDGLVVYRGFEPITLVVPPNRDLASLDISAFEELTAISLRGARLSQSSLQILSRLKNLRSVNLSRTDFADSDIKHILLGNYLDYLSLEETKVTDHGINEILDMAYVNTLNIGSLQLNDEMLMRVDIDQTRQLVLKGNPITDESLRFLAPMVYLDLSETKISGTAFSSLTNVQTLLLDGTSIDDSAITSLSGVNFALGHLSLRNTRVTDASLKVLAQFPNLNELALGDGEISSSGIAAAALTVKRLSLNSRKFDGKIFSAWKPTINFLDLSHSGFSDADVHELLNIAELRELSLEHCDISERSLETLAALKVIRMDLTGTKVTGAQAVRAFPDTTEVYLAPSQCGPEELDTPASKTHLRIGRRFEGKDF